MPVQSALQSLWLASALTDTRHTIGHIATSMLAGGEFDWMASGLHSDRMTGTLPTHLQGRPVYIQHIGAIKIKQLAEITTEDRMIRFHVQVGVLVCRMQTCCVLLAMHSLFSAVLNNNLCSPFLNNTAALC